MVIFLGVLGEFVTILSSLFLQVKGSKDHVLEIPKNGYKISKDVFDKYDEMRMNSENSNSLKRFLNIVLLLIPGINIGYSIFKNYSLRKNIMKSLDINNALVLMTEEEKENYLNCFNKKEKLMYFLFLCDKEKEEENFLNPKKVVVLERGVECLRYEKLPDTFSLDEVRKLNIATNYTYRIGIVNDVYTAIVGIPNPNTIFTRIRFNDSNVHYFINVDEGEVHDKKFVVYPFMREFYSDNKMQDIYNNILINRANSGKINNSEMVNEDNISNKKLVKDFKGK